MTWAKEISEGAHVGTTTPQGAPGVLARPGGLCPPIAPPLVIFAPKILKFQEKSYKIFRAF